MSTTLEHMSGEELVNLFQASVIHQTLNPTDKKGKDVLALSVELNRRLARLEAVEKAWNLYKSHHGDYETLQ